MHDHASKFLRWWHGYIQSELGKSQAGKMPHNIAYQAWLAAVKEMEKEKGNNDRLRNIH